MYSNQVCKLNYKMSDSILIIRVTKNMKKYTSAKHLLNFIQRFVTNCLVPFSKCILHYKNIPTCTLFEHVQYID